MITPAELKEKFLDDLKSYIFYRKSGQSELIEHYKASLEQYRTYENNEYDIDFLKMSKKLNREEILKKLLD